MRTSAFLPVGELGEFKNELIEKGDIIILDGGKTYTFLEMKQKYFIALETGTEKRWRIPRWRLENRLPSIAKKTGKKDKSVLANVTKKTNLKYGDLFSLEGKKETFMFLENTTKRGGKPVMKAIDLASGRTFTIGEGFTLVKVNLAKIKRENKITV